ncbi:MAG: hypothetical protein FWC26_13620 [Fibromonadales bacterium]|nr:hypothetical protein [Fibromonadales bacterium]
MAKSQKSTNIGGWKKEPDNKTDWLRAMLTFPLLEAIIALVLGLIFFQFKLKTLAELTWVLGPLLSVSRRAFEKHVENEFNPLKKLTRHVDLIQSDTSDSFKRIIQFYAQITEPDFREIKENILRNTETQLSNLAHNKRSEELDTGEYFNWLFKFLANTRPGSRIWAISMNLSIEWNQSQEEDTFLQLNLNAAARTVIVERIFVIPEDALENIVSNKYIKAQLNVNEHLIPLFVTKEHLEEVDKKLLKSLGEGIIAVDNQVVLMDIASGDGFRGIVTMNPTEIHNWHRRFKQLRVYASDIDTLRSSLSSTSSNLLH